MATYKFMELVGTSSNSWEEAAKSAIEDAKEAGAEGLRVAEVLRMDVKIIGASLFYRVRMKVSFKVTRDTMNLGNTEMDD